MKVGEAVLGLNILGDEIELAEGYLIVLQISEAHFKDTSFQTV